MRAKLPKFYSSASISVSKVCKREGSAAPRSQVFSIESWSLNANRKISSFNPALGRYKDFAVCFGQEVIDVHRGVSSEKIGYDAAMGVQLLTERFTSTRSESSTTPSGPNGCARRSAKTRSDWLEKCGYHWALYAFCRRWSRVAATSPGMTTTPTYVSEAG